MKENIKCKLFGHKQGDLNDSGYPICLRCKSHSYYEYNAGWTNGGLFMQPFYWISRKWYNMKCNFNYYYGRIINGDNELPF